MLVNRQTVKDAALKFNLNAKINSSIYVALQMAEELHTLGSHDFLSNSSSYNAALDSPYTPHMVDKMRRKLKFHFMTPCEKFKARKRKPWKLVIQLAKIIILTSQVSYQSVDSAFIGQYKTKNIIMHLQIHLDVKTNDDHCTIF